MFFNLKSLFLDGFHSTWFIVFFLWCFFLFFFTTSLLHTILSLSKPFSHPVFTISPWKTLKYCYFWIPFNYFSVFALHVLLFCLKNNQSNVSKCAALSQYYQYCLLNHLINIYIYIYIFFTQISLRYTCCSLCHQAVQLGIMTKITEQHDSLEQQNPINKSLHVLRH